MRSAQAKLTSLLATLNRTPTSPVQAAKGLSDIWGKKIGALTSIHKSFPSTTLTSVSPEPVLCVDLDGLEDWREEIDAVADLTAAG